MTADDAQPRPFQVAGINGPQDCELWPDGHITMRIGTEVLVNALPFDEMHDMGWTDDRITWDTAPVPVLEPVEADAEPVQDDLFSAAARRRTHTIPDIAGYTPLPATLAVAELLAKREAS